MKSVYSMQRISEKSKENISNSNCYLVSIWDNFKLPCIDDTDCICMNSN